MTLRRRSYLAERGKSAEIPIPGKPKSPQEWRQNKNAYRYDAISAVKKVLTWSKGEGEFQSSVIRFIPAYSGERSVDYVFQIYRLNPDADKSEKLRVFVFEKGRINEFAKLLGDVDNIRSAKKLARDWLIDRAIVLHPKGIERISMQTKMVKMPEEVERNFAMILRRRGYLFEADYSQWTEKGSGYGSGNMNPKYVKEITDEIESKLPKKAYKISSKVKEGNKATLSGEMMGVGPFSVVVDIVSNKGPRNVGYKTFVTVLLNVKGVDKKFEKTFSGTAAPNTIAKWPVRELNDWR